jgi:hypothetical protein
MNGLEILWQGEHTYPNDYPEMYAEIEVAGIFESYEELGQTYYHLIIDSL